MPSIASIYISIVILLSGGSSLPAPQSSVVSVLPWLQAAAFSATAINHGLQISKTLKKSDKQP